MIESVAPHDIVTTSQPVGASNSTQQTAAQVAVPIQADTDVGVGVAADTDLTGIAIQSALPSGLALLLAWIVYLSHRREMQRLRRNGKAGAP